MDLLRCFQCIQLFTDAAFIPLRDKNINSTLKNETQLDYLSDSLIVNERMNKYKLKMPAARGTPVASLFNYRSVWLIASV